MFLGRRDMREKKTWRCVGLMPGSHANRGFTLIELLIVILVIAVLVGIAIPIYFAVAANAKEAAAQYNQRAGEGALNALWTDFQGRTSPLIINYWENTGQTTKDLHFASTVSRYQRNMKCLHIYGSSTGTNVLRTHVLYKNNTQIEAAVNELPPRADGRVGFARMYRNGTTWTRNYDVGDTIAAPHQFEYITVINKVAGKTKTYFATYKLGHLCDSGTFDWNLTTGATTNFVTD